jgi:hypothetical protein
MKFNSQLLELHHLICCSLWDLTCVTFLYRWLSLCFTSSKLKVRSVPTDCTRRVFHALRGKHSAPLATPLHRLTRCPSSSAWAFPVAEWSSLCYHTRTTRLIRFELRLLGFYYPRGRRVSCSSSVDGFLWAQPYCGGSLAVRVVSSCESSQPDLSGLYGSLAGAADVNRATECHSDAGTLS